LESQLHDAPRQADKLARPLLPSYAEQSTTRRSSDRVGDCHAERDIVMSNAITNRDLIELVSARGDRFVSIYLPTFPSGKQSEQNPIRFKNLLRAAEQSLNEKGMNATDAHALLDPASDLLNRPEFWRSLDRGLAVLVSRDGMRVWNAPFEFQEQCVVGKRFHITPVIEWAAADHSYYVLAISQNRVRLLHGTRDALEEVEVPGLPANRSQALAFDEPESGFQTHTGRPEIRGKEGAVFTGQGGAPDAAKNEIVSFFREVDRALAAVVDLKTSCLIFAGVDYLFPIYRRANSHPKLLPGHLSGNPDLLPLAELKQRAWSLLQPSLDNLPDSRIAKYWDLAARSRTSNQVEEIIPAAQAGAVEVLFLDPAVHRLGTFNPATFEVRIDSLRRPDSEDLINLAATLVLQNSGAVQSSSTRQVPGGGAMAAIMRYPFSSPNAAVAGGANVPISI
jgi:hypothetical protein